MSIAPAGPEIITLGCRLNISESEALAASLAGRDDVIIVNSCAVTNEAVRNTRQTIRKARRRRPDAHIVVTGCAAQVEPAMFEAMAEVDAVRGNAEKLNPALFLPEAAQRSAVADIMAVRETAPHLAESFADHVRAFVEVQNGCDHRCTFCIIPFGRGNSRSVPAGQVIDTIRRLVDQGYKEVVLTGVDVTSYGHDLPGDQTLGHLVERIIRLVPDLPRLRLSSLDGVEIDARLFDLMTTEQRVMPHLHLSLQAGDNLTLKRMKRRHSREQAIELVQRLHAVRPELAIGADLIAGFPTETDAMFENSLNIINECRIVHGHIFPYSARTGTPAARMPQVEIALRKERAALLRNAVADQKARWLHAQIGSRQQLLVEGNGRSGHTPHFAEVRLNAPARAGDIMDIDITAAHDGWLEGNIAR